MTEQQQGKGRPTPKRREAEKRRGGPVSAPPTNRKEASAQAKARAAEAKLAKKQGRRVARPPVERMLPARDHGPVRRRVRDLVDARRNVGGLLLPLALAMVVTNSVKDPGFQAFVSALFLSTVLACAIDFFLLSRLIRKVIAAEFPQETKLGRHAGYGILRSTTIRRMRFPRPEMPRGGKG